MKTVCKAYTTRTIILRENMPTNITKTKKCRGPAALSYNYFLFIIVYWCLLSQFVYDKCVFIFYFYLCRGAGIRTRFKFLQKRGVLIPAPLLRAWPSAQVNKMADERSKRRVMDIFTPEKCIYFGNSDLSPFTSQWICDKAFLRLVTTLLSKCQH